jgi:hypothetical protein
MSTTFGILRPNRKPHESKFIEIAERVYAGHFQCRIIWKDPKYATCFVGVKKVFPLNNTAQGVYNINDLKKINNEKPCYCRTSTIVN